MPQRKAPWVLALVLLPPLGAALWVALMWFDPTFDDLGEIGIRASPALALPTLLTFVVVRMRKIHLGVSVALVIGSAGCTLVWAALPVLAVAFSGVG